jgi:hypothetical protein
MRVEVIAAHTSQYPEPICFAVGEPIQVGRGDPNFPGWFWCRTAAGSAGWVHQSFLAESDLHGGSTTSVAAYSARELTVSGGERGTLLRQLDGWAWLRLDGGEEGWIPMSCFAPRDGK